VSLQFGVNSRIQLGSRSGDWVAICFRMGHIHIYIQIILFNPTLDKTSIQKATDESTTMAKTQRTPRPQKSPAKAKAAVNQMKGAATNAPHSPNQSEDSDEPDEPGVPDEAEVKVEAEQKIKVDDFFLDDGATGIQSVMEASAAVVSLSGVSTKKTVLAVGPKKPKAKKPSPSKTKMMASKEKKPGPPSDDQLFWLRFFELCRYKADHGTTTVPRSKHGTNNVLANWIHYIRKRYASNLLADKYKSSLNGINFEWTVGQITKKGFKGWFAELVEYHKQNGTVEVLGENKKKNPQLAKWGNYARRTAIAALANKKKDAVFTLQRCKMLVDIGLVSLQFYQYGSDDSDGVGEHQDNTRRNATQTLTETTSTVTQSLKAIIMNMPQFVASTSSKMAKDKNQNIEEDQYIQDEDDRKPAAVVFDIACNVTHPLIATIGNNTQSLAATSSNVAQSLAATTSNVDVDFDDRKPAAVVFANACNVTHPLEATAVNKTQSLAATASNITESLTATASDLAQSTVAAIDSNMAQSLEAMARNVAQSAVFATDSDVFQSLTAMASNVAQSTVAATGNTEAELASFSPEMIAEDAAAREMLLEQPPLSPQVIETLLAIFHLILFLQPLTILPFIHRWLQMMLRQEKIWKKIAKHTSF
jgi:hypothetical protein